MYENAVVAASMSSLAKKFEGTDIGLSSVFDVAAIVAVSDGHVDDAESAALAETLRKMFGDKLSAFVIKGLVASSLDAIAKSGLEAHCATVGAAMAARGCVEEGLVVGLAVALASNGISTEERHAIDAIARAAGSAPARVDELLAKIQQR